MLIEVGRAQSSWKKAALQLDDLIEVYELASSGAGRDAKQAATEVRKVWSGDLPLTRIEMIDQIEAIVKFEMSMTNFLEYHKFDFDADARRVVHLHPFFKHTHAAVSSLNRAIDRLAHERN